MIEGAREVLAGKEAWVVGGAVRDELLSRPVVDLDIATAEPERAARAYARRSGGAPFPLSERHGAWRVALDGDRTVDFTPLRDGIDADLATRDFAINAIAQPLEGGALHDPFDGRGDVARRTIRAVSPTVFSDDPVRLLRSVRLEEELGFALDAGTERLVREHAHLAGKPSGERVLGELRRMGPAAYLRLDELGLLAPLGGSAAKLGLADATADADFLLVCALGESLLRYPVSRELARYAQTLLRARPPEDDSPRAIHRFRRATEPWSLEALQFLGEQGFSEAVRGARERDPAEPLVRGDELGVPAGPRVGELLDLVEEEYAVGTIATREEALALVRRHVDG